MAKFSVLYSIACLVPLVLASTSTVRDSWSDLNTNLFTCKEDDASNADEIYYENVFTDVDLKIVPVEGTTSCSQYGIQRKVALIDIMIGEKVTLDFKLEDSSELDAEYELYVYDLDTEGNLHQTRVTVVEGTNPIALSAHTKLGVYGNKFTSPALPFPVPNVRNPKRQLSPEQAERAIKIGFKENVVKIELESLRKGRNNRKSNIFFSIKRKLPINREFQYVPVTRSIVNNLGGLVANDDKTPKEWSFGNIIYRGKEIKMTITNLTEYTPLKMERTEIISDKVIQMNFKANTDARFKIQFTNAANGRPVKINKATLLVLDMDQYKCTTTDCGNNKCQRQERVQFFGNPKQDSYKVGKDVCSMGSNQFTSKIEAQYENNLITDVDSVESRSISVEAFYEKVDSIEFNWFFFVGPNEDARARNAQFAVGIN